MNNKALSKEELLARCAWQEGGLVAKVSLNLAPFGKVEVHVETKEIQILSDRSVEIINGLLNLDENAMYLVKQYLFDSCRECCVDSDYGAEVRLGQTQPEANHELFGVHNPEDALAKSHLKYVCIDENEEGLKGNYGLFTFDNEWNSHLDVIVMKDGKIVGRGDSGLYLGAFEKK